MVEHLGKIRRGTSKLLRHDSLGHCCCFNSNKQRLTVEIHRDAGDSCAQVPNSDHESGELVTGGCPGLEQLGNRE